MKDFEMNLPPLPEPAGKLGYEARTQWEDDWISSEDAYTESQLREYAAQVVEACAKSVEALERNGAWVTREEVLNAIRRMK